MADETRHTNGSGTAEGARRVTGAGPLGPNQRWTVTRTREAALRLLRGEPMDALVQFSRTTVAHRGQVFHLLGVFFANVAQVQGQHRVRFDALAAHLYQLPHQPSDSATGGFRS